MTKITNPWLKLDISSYRRVDSNINHNYFWIINEKGNYGLRINIKQPINISKNLQKLKGINILTNNLNNGTWDIFLLLTNNNDWKIFISLCNDLIENSINIKDDIHLIKYIIKRLLKWQKFLSQNNECIMTEIKQMGLITELLCLKDFIFPNYSITESIISWVGPEFDKQDFSLNSCFIEVKSYIASKGNIIRISSLNQLNNKIKPLYLLVFGISKTEVGISIKSIIENLKLIIGNDEIALDMFENKLALNGYIEEITEGPFYEYNIDSINSYFVSDEFPKILTNQVKHQIISAEYSIDLSRCIEFETSLLLELKK